MQRYRGIAPVTESSGQSKWVHWRWACPKFLRQTFHEYAGQSIHCCDWAKEYYEGQRTKRKSHHAAVRSLAFKWMRIMFRCWRDRQPYDNARYERALALRNPKPEPKPEPVQKVELVWETCAGFSTLAVKDR
jgi:hypothetical protein